MSENVILLHCHIFKNGGSTIDSVLRENFGFRAIFRESSDCHKFLLSGEIIDIVESADCGEVASISSHRMGLPAPSHPSLTFIPLVMIREPLDRLGSMFSFYRRQRDETGHEYLLAKKTSFKEFVETLMGADLDSSFTNLQCQFFLGNYSFPKHPTEKTWATIAENLNTVPCVGVLDKFDESMILWEQNLRQFLPSIDLSYTKQNVSHERAQNLDERLEFILEELAEKLVAEFKKRNEFDYRMYNLVKNKIIEKIGDISGFSEKLLQFRKRHKIEVGTIKAEGPSRTIACNVVDGLNENIQNDVVFLMGGKKCSLPRIYERMETVSSSSIHIIGCGLFDQQTGQLLRMVKHGQSVDLVVVVEVKDNISKPIVGITVENDKHEIVFVMNSLHSVKSISCLTIGEIESFAFCFKIPPLNSGSYAVTPAFASGTQDDHVILCCVKDAVLFFVPKMIEQRMPGFLYINNFDFKSE